jgi:hypothetical protein
MSLFLITQDGTRIPKDTTPEDIKDVLVAIAEGYPVRGEHDRYVVVENPRYMPDNGENPCLVIDTWRL